MKKISPLSGADGLSTADQPAVGAMGFGIIINSGFSA
jgi:hypothetical protein